MTDRSESILIELEKKLNLGFKSNIDLVTKETTKTVEECERLQIDSQKRFNSYYNRKKLIDYLIYVNLAITPMLLIFLVYITVIKK